METPYLENIIGQEAVKSRLKIYSDAYSHTGRLPFLMLSASRGGGKTKIVREFRKTLVRPDGTAPPLLEVNSATVKSADAFFEQIYPKWVENKAVLFFDEAHILPDRLMEIFLSVLEKDKNPVRRVTYEIKGGGHEDFIFDFNEISIIMATTDHQKISEPLNDRLTNISLAQYTEEELFDIFLLNCTCGIQESIREVIKAVFRGHPRNCVEIGEDLERFALSRGCQIIDEKLFSEFCDVMGIYMHGFNEAEIQIIKILGNRGECSLEAIAATTGFSKQVIRSKYEHALLKKGIMDIKGKRSLTRKGINFYRELI